MNSARIPQIAGVVVSATSNRTIVFGLTVIGILATLGALGGAIAVVRDRRAKRWRLEMCDDLTGVGNRRRLDRDLAIEAASAETPVAVIKIDIDHFQRVNDEHGREAGDEVLRQLADVLRAECRVGDVVYRYEDEEFCILLAKTTTAEAGQVAERMRFGVSRMALAVAEPLALSKSKVGGRDRVTLAAQPLLGPLAVRHPADSASGATFG